MDEDHRRSDNGDNVVAHDVKCRHRIIVDVIDVEVHLAHHGIKRTSLPSASTIDKQWVSGVKQYPDTIQYLMVHVKQCRARLDLVG